MNNSNCSVNREFIKRFLVPVYSSVLIIGLLANGWGLKSLLQNWNKLGNVNVFVLNLGLTDILHLLTLPFLIVYYAMDRNWIFGDALCKITRFCFNLNLYGSIGFLTCISVYRYLAIVHPMRVMGRITVTHTVAISVMVWLLVSVQCLPDMFFTKTLENNTEKCLDTVDKDVERYLEYNLGWALTGFCIPFLITLGCYGHMIVVICKTNRIDKVLKQRSLKLLFITMLLFSVCYIPYFVTRNLHLWSRVLTKQRDCRGWFNGVLFARRISSGLVCMNSALNPLVYLHGNENIGAQLMQLLQRAWQAVIQLFNRCSHVPVVQII
ncbi:P2Y purinoceptor 1 [Larimichthys crocea]|uniref:P2Y purinoceptor 1 n=1 Tax=Larimichthys crocea TaxID=215358 RepID=UPI000F5FA05A|nr:P2Y purinoceptor 1 [Larimichthys crocea]